MQLMWFVVTLVCLYWGTFFGMAVWIKKHPDQAMMQRLPAVVAGFSAATFMLGVAVCHIIFSAPKLSIYTMIGVLLVAVLFFSAKLPEYKKIWIPVVCVAGTYVLHRLFPSITFEYGTYLLMAVVWVAVMLLSMFLDTLPLLSFFTIAAWAFAFSSVLFLEGIVPPMFAVICWLIVAPLWATIRVSAQWMKGSLGPYGSAFLGFVMGGIVAAFVGFGAYSSALSLCGYYLFEMLMFSLPWIGVHPLGMKKGDFAYIVAMQKGNPAAIIRSVFYHLVILSLLAVLVWQKQSVWSLLGVIALVDVVVLWHIYNQFKLFGQPKPSMKQMLCDTKDAIQTLWGQKETAKNTQTKDVSEQKEPCKAVPKKTNRKKGKKKK